MGSALGDTQTASATPQHNNNAFFPLGSKLVKRVEEQPNSVAVKSVETPVSFPEHSKLLKNNIENQHRLDLERTKSDAELKMGLVRIPKPRKTAQQTGPKSLLTIRTFQGYLNYKLTVRSHLCNLRYGPPQFRPTLALPIRSHQCNRQLSQIPP